MTTIVMIDHRNYNEPKSIVVTRRMCQSGVHSTIMNFISDEIGLPWDDDNKLLQEIVSDIGIPNGYLEEDGGEIKFLKPLPSLAMYDKLGVMFSNLYLENFFRVKVINR